MYVCISLLNRVPRVDQLFKYRISSNNSQGDNYFLSHQKGTDDYLREATILNIAPWKSCPKYFVL